MPVTTGTLLWESNVSTETEPQQSSMNSEGEDFSNHSVNCYYIFLRFGNFPHKNQNEPRPPTCKVHKDAKEKLQCAPSDHQGPMYSVCRQCTQAVTNEWYSSPKDFLAHTPRTGLKRVFLCLLEMSCACTCACVCVCVGG